MLIWGMLMTAIGGWVLGTIIIKEYKLLALLGYIITIIGSILVGMSL